MNTADAHPSYLIVATRYLVSFLAGIIAGVLFWLLRTPTPVPPLIGLVGLLGIAFGELIAGSIVEAVRQRRDHASTDAAVPRQWKGKS